MNGATVYMACDAKDLGSVLHMLEDTADVFVLEKVTRVDPRTIDLQLRSDRFPADWNGREVGAVVECGMITEFVLVVRAK